MNPRTLKAGEELFNKMMAASFLTQRSRIIEETRKQEDGETLLAEFVGFANNAYIHANSELNRKTETKAAALHGVSDDYVPDDALSRVDAVLFGASRRPATPRPRNVSLENLKRLERDIDALRKKTEDIETLTGQFRALFNEKSGPTFSGTDNRPRF